MKLLSNMVRTRLPHTCLLVCTWCLACCMRFSLWVMFLCHGPLYRYCIDILPYRLIPIINLLWNHYSFNHHSIAAFPEFCLSAQKKSTPEQTDKQFLPTHWDITRNSLITQEEKLNKKRYWYQFPLTPRYWLTECQRDSKKACVHMYSVHSSGLLSPKDAG